jgi:hypothetical protein
MRSMKPRFNGEVIRGFVGARQRSIVANRAERRGCRGEVGGMQNEVDPPSPCVGIARERVRHRGVRIGEPALPGEREHDAVGFRIEVAADNSRSRRPPIEDLDELGPAAMRHGFGAVRLPLEMCGDDREAGPSCRKCNMSRSIAEDELLENRRRH